jgi:hypothetical protein
MPRLCIDRFLQLNNDISSELFLSPQRIEVPFPARYSSAGFDPKRRGSPEEADVFAVLHKKVRSL